MGYDAAKRIKGRKRHLLVDTLGLVLGVAVTPASTTERAGTQLVLGRVLGWFTWLRILWVDGGDTGDPAPNAPKWFAAVEMIRLAVDRDWLHKATKEISKYWRNKRERRLNLPS